MKTLRNTHSFVILLRARVAVALVLLLACSRAFANQPRVRWTEDQAWAYMQSRPWPLGSNYLPTTAINQLEMFQVETFDPVEIDREFGWAESAGMTTMRVFLHDLLWEQDQNGFTQRLNILLSIGAKHRIRFVLVLFDSCWDPKPKLGPQHPPIAGIHNSGWVQSPGVALENDANRLRFEAYVKGVVGTFANDDRILAWDVWNEPDNPGGGKYKDNLKDKVARVNALLPEVFKWARSQGPTQPLTSGVWTHDSWGDPQQWSTTEKIQLSESDIISFHDYSWPEKFESRVESLERLHRPVLCTEYMARGAGSTIDTILPVAMAHKVGMINWGLVQGKMQTYLPWDSWDIPYVDREPTIWFHDLYRPDGTPYRSREIELLRKASKSMKTGQPN